MDERGNHVTDEGRNIRSGGSAIEDFFPGKPRVHSLGCHANQRSFGASYRREADLVLFCVRFPAHVEILIDLQIPAWRVSRLLLQATTSSEARRTDPCLAICHSLPLLPPLPDLIP